MSSLSKSKKRSKGLNIRQRDDRITNLPSCLIIKILSCLPTKEAVATGVLSTKWKRSWTSITNLDFCDDKLLHSLNDAENVRKFTSFVTRVLSLRDRLCLQRATMNLSLEYDGSLVNAWLIAILQCNVQELDVTFCAMGPLLLLPSDMFLSSTLVVLKLHVEAEVLLTSACLPSLKTLHLAEVLLFDDVSLPNLLSASPVLEELKLYHCAGIGMRVVNISACALKNLIIEFLAHDLGEGYIILIDTPALEYFSFEDYIAEVDVVNMNHLIEAKIDFSVDKNLSTNKLRQDVKLFLDGLSEVKKLVLSQESMMIINSGNPPLPKFDKLVHLKLDVFGDPGWKLVAKLLENSPHLESLYIKLQDLEMMGDMLPFPFHDVPSCFLFHLKNIEIEQLEYKKDDMMMVEYILKNTKVLEKLTLHYFNVKDHAKFLKELLSMPRASVNCKVVACDL